MKKLLSIFCLSLAFLVHTANCQIVAHLEYLSGEVISCDAGNILVDGNTSLEVWKIRDNFYRVVLRNLGKPGWVVGEWRGTEGLGFRRVWFEQDSSQRLEVAYGAMRGVGENLIDMQSVRDKHERVPESKDYPWLEGGTSIYWDIKLPGPYGPPKVDPELRKKIEVTRGMLPGIVPNSLTGFNGERLLQLRSLQTASSDSLFFTSTRRDIGWLTLNWAKRFSASKPEATGPFAWGALIGADGHRNWSYDSISSIVDLFLRTGDPWAWELAYIATLHKLHQGLYISPKTRSAGFPRNVHGRYAYEKGSYPGRPGDYRFPEPSHEWDAGPLMVGLISGDPEILNCLQHRKQGLLDTYVTSQRSFGARLRGWYLWNLRQWFGMTEDKVFLARAQQIHDIIWASVKPGEKWFMNDVSLPGNKNVDPWQQALMFSEMLRLKRVGLRLDPRFDEFVRETINRGSKIVTTNYGPALEGFYTLNIETGTYTSPWPSTAVFFLPLLKEYPEFKDRHSAAITSTCAMAFAAGAWDLPVSIPSRELQIDYSRGGPHGAKTLAQILVFMEDIDF